MYDSLPSGFSHFSQPTNTPRPIERAWAGDYNEAVSTLSTGGTCFVASPADGGTPSLRFALPSTRLSTLSIRLTRGLTIRLAGVEAILRASDLLRKRGHPAD